MHCAMSNEGDGGLCLGAEPVDVEELSVHSVKYANSRGAW